MAPPVNDDIANAVALTLGATAVSGTTVDASLETGEPDDFFNQSVWYKFSPASSGYWNVSWSDPNAYHQLAMYEAPSNTETDFTNLAYVGSTSAALFPFDFVSGHHYYIRVACYNNQPAAFTISIPNAPANNNFANRRFMVFGQTYKSTTVGATSETGEAFGDATKTQSVWYAINKGSRVVDIDITTNDPDAQVTVFTGTAVNALTQRATGVQSVSFTTLASPTTYLVQVATNAAGEGSHDISFDVTDPPAGTPPANDDFVNAIDLGSSLSGSVSFDMTNGTWEPEDFPSGLQWDTTNTRTVWYKWTCPAGVTQAKFTLAPTGGTTRLYALSAQSGPQLAATANVASGATTGLQPFIPTPGVTYYLEVWQNKSQPASTGTLSWNHRTTPLVPPANDDFADAIVLTDGVQVSGTLVDSSVEADEWWSQNGGSVWYKFTAPATQSYDIVATMDGTGLPANAELQIPVFTVNPPATSQTDIATNPGWAAVRASGMTRTFAIPATAGVTYWISVWSAWNHAAPFTLRVGSTPAPPNNNFADAEVLTHQTQNLAGTTLGSNLETGEPNPGSLTGSVWYQYTPPATWTGGEIAFRAPGQTVKVFTGTSLGNLTEVPTTSSVEGEARWQGSVGTTYFLQVGPTASQTPGPIAVSYTGPDYGVWKVYDYVNGDWVKPCGSTGTGRVTFWANNPSLPDIPQSDPLGSMTVVGGAGCLGDSSDATYVDLTTTGDAELGISSHGEMVVTFLGTLPADAVITGVSIIARTSAVNRAGDLLLWRLDVAQDAQGGGFSPYHGEIYTPETHPFPADDATIVTRSGMELNGGAMPTRAELVGGLVQALLQVDPAVDPDTVRYGGTLRIYELGLEVTYTGTIAVPRLKVWDYVNGMWWRTRCEADPVDEYGSWRQSPLQEFVEGAEGSVTTEEFQFNRAAGGPFPEDEDAAVDCAWNHARHGFDNGTFHYWSPGNLVEWNGGPGTCPTRPSPLDFQMTSAHSNWDDVRDFWAGMTYEVDHNLLSDTMSWYANYCVWQIGANNDTWRNTEFLPGTHPQTPPPGSAGGGLDYEEGPFGAYGTLESGILEFNMSGYLGGVPTAHEGQTVEFWKVPYRVDSSLFGPYLESATQSVRVRGGDPSTMGGTLLGSGTGSFTYVLTQADIDDIKNVTGSSGGGPYYAFCIVAMTTAMRTQSIAPASAGGTGGTNLSRFYGVDHLSCRTKLQVRPPRHRFKFGGKRLKGYDYVNGEWSTVACMIPESTP